MEAAYPISMVKTSMLKNTYSSMQSTGELSKVEQLAEDYTPFSTKTIFKDTTTHNITPQYTHATNVGSNSQKSFTEKVVIMTVILTTNISPVVGSNSLGVFTDSPYHVNVLVGNTVTQINPNTKRDTSSIEDKGIELEEAKTYNEDTVGIAYEEEINMNGLIRTYKSMLVVQKVVAIVCILFSLFLIGISAVLPIPYSLTLPVSVIMLYFPVYISYLMRGDKK